MADNKYVAKNTSLSKQKLNEFYIHANTIVDFNKWLITNSCSDRESLGLMVMELLYELLEDWSGNNETLHQWTHAECKDFGNIIFIHAYYKPAEVVLHIGMNGEGIYLQMNTRTQVTPVNSLPDDIKKYLLLLSTIGEFETGEEYDDFLIMWPYEKYSIIDIFSNGSIAFSLMYQLSKEINQTSHL
jgi:hypothetical protein